MLLLSSKLFAGVDMRFDATIGNPPYQKGKNITLVPSL